MTMTEVIATVTAVAAVLTVVVMWLDLRHRSNSQHSENKERVDKQFGEIQVRLTRLETMMDPIVKWFNNGRSKE